MTLFLINKEHELDKMANLKLKSFYVGNFKFDTNCTNHISTNFTKLDLKEYTQSNNINKNYLTSLNSKLSILYDDPILSGACSPWSDILEIDKSQSKIRFIPKDSHDSLDALNQNMTSKVKLKSRNDVAKEDEKVRRRDMEIRKIRRSQERLKSNKEREIIRLHKHKKWDSKLKLEDPNNLTNWNTFDHIDLYGNNKYMPNLNKSSSQTKRILLHKTGIKMFPQEDNESDFKLYDSSNHNDNIFVLSAKYDKLNRRSIDFHNKKVNAYSGEDTNSPIKKWNKRAKEENNPRVLLYSHVFNS